MIISINPKTLSNEVQNSKYRWKPVKNLNGSIRFINFYTVRCAIWFTDFFTVYKQTPKVWDNNQT